MVEIDVLVLKKATSQVDELVETLGAMTMQGLDSEVADDVELRRARSLIVQSRPPIRPVLVFVVLHVKLGKVAAEEAHTVFAERMVTVQLETPRIQHLGSRHRRGCECENLGS